MPADTVAGRIRDAPCQQLIAAAAIPIGDWHGGHSGGGTDGSSGGGKGGRNGGSSLVSSSCGSGCMSRGCSRGIGRGSLVNVECGRRRLGGVASRWAVGRILRIEELGQAA